MTENTRWTFISVCAALAVFAAFVAAMWAGGFLQVTGADANSKVVAAALALVGAFFGSAVTLVGMLLKHSVDDRSERRLTLDAERNAALSRETEERLKLDAERNAVLQKEAEERLKLEAAIRAVQLFTTNKGEMSPPIQLTGALFGLASLGQHELTLALAQQLLAKKALDSAAVAHLLDEALSANDEDVGRMAVDMLANHPEAMLSPQGRTDLPVSLVMGIAGQPRYVREWATMGLASVLAARPVKKWNTDEAATIVGTLAIAWEEETEEDLKSDCAVFLGLALGAFPGFKILCHPRKEIDVGQIRQQLERSAKPSGATTSRIAERLRRWAAEGQHKTGSV